jgi:hypothetical protein
MSQQTDWEKVMHEAFKSLGRMKGVKGSAFEALYSQAYNKLVSEGKRQKLRKKYQV